MKKNKLSMLVALLLCVFMVIAASNSGNTYSTSPPVNRCGLYGTQPTCTACHTFTGTNDATNSIALSGNPSGYVFGQTYTITVTATGGSKYGFEMACVRQSNNTNAGSFATAFGTGISSGNISGNAISFIYHNAVNTSGTWTFNWTAPTSNIGNVVFYLATNSANSSNSVSGDKIKTLVYTLPPDCSSTVAMINPPNATICTGGIQNLTASGGNSYVWSTGATTTDIITQTEGVYTVTTTASNGCTATATAIVQVATNPVVNITGGGEICQGGQATLTASGGVVYAWSNGATSASTVVSPTIATTYTVTVTNQSACISTASTTVTVNPNAAPVATATNAYICSGACATLTAASSINPSTYLWSNGLTTAGINVCPPNIGTNPYTVTVTAASGCTASYSTFVQVFNNVVATISSPAPICQGGSAVIQASGGSTYSWSNGATTSSINVSPTLTTTYTVTVSSASSCPSTATTTLVVNAIQAAISGNSTLCQGGSTTLTATGGGTYQWSNGATTTAIIAAPTTTTSYTVTVTNNGCTATAVRTVSVGNILATATNAYVCAGQCATLTAASSITPANYTWSNGATTTAITVCPLNFGTNPYTVTVTASGGCSATYSTFVDVSPYPVPTITPSSAICAGSSTTLSASGGAYYTWSPATGLSATTGASVTANPTSTTTYTVIVSSQTGCTASASTTVTVSNPTVSIGNITQPICNAGGTLGAFVTGGISPYTRSWSNGATTVSISNLSPNTYTVTVTDAVGCTKTATATLTNQTLGTPTNLNTTNITNTNATFQWTAVAGAATYTIQGRKVGSSTWTTLAPTANTSRTVSVLQACKNYEWRVRANCSDGLTSGAISGIVSFTTTGCGIAGKTETSDLFGNVLELFPNPANNECNLYYESNKAGTQADLLMTDLSGKIVQQQSYSLNEGTNHLKIDISQLPAGYYLIRFSHEQESYYQRLIVE